jgi:hypothetical protein
MHKPSHRRTRRNRIAAGTVVVVLVALAIVLVAERTGGSSTSQAGAGATSLGTQITTKGLAPASTAAPTTASSLLGRTTNTTVAARPTTTVRKTPLATRSSCQSVVHIGDSTSESLDSANYLPNPLQRLSARYALVGAAHQSLQISGARSIVETYQGEPNAYAVAQRIAADGYQGCWVVAMGVNDAADIAVGSHVNAPERIERMMSVIKNQPVLWIAVKTLLTSGPYAESNMAAWNAALLKACATHPNMRVLNWSAEAQPSDYIADGIHYNSPGSAVLALAFARGLARAFPQPGPSPAQCLVS